jgi:hypothetical protein
MAPAFKEWRMIVEALGRGDQIIILRKGGLAEGRTGFQADRHPRFWLFPTEYHQQAEKTKPEIAAQSGEAPVRENEVTLQFVAEVSEAIWIQEWKKIAALADRHGWTEATVRDHFEYDAPKGLYLLVVRIYRAFPPMTLTLTKAFGGCRSWIDVPTAFPEKLTAVLAETDFQQQRAEILAHIAV